MINYSKYTTKNGLKVTYVYKPDFTKCYAGIGVKYGGCNISYTADGVEYYDKPGLAHFLEHCLFHMPYGDAYNEFNKLNAHANAYTSPDKTLYFFNTNFALNGSPGIKTVLAITFSLSHEICGVGILLIFKFLHNRSTTRTTDTVSS